MTSCVTSTPEETDTEPAVTGLRAVLPAGPPTEDPLPALHLPTSALPPHANREARYLDELVRMVWAMGGTATYEQIRERVPAAMGRPEGDIPGNLTPLTITLRRAVADGWFAHEHDGYEGTYHLRDSGAWRADLPRREHDDLRHVLRLVDDLRIGITRMIERPGEVRADYEGLAYKLAEAIVAAGTASTRAGIAENRSAFLQRVDAAFHDMTRGR